MIGLAATFVRGTLSVPTLEVHPTAPLLVTTTTQVAPVLTFKTLYGANISNLTLKDLQSISGTLSIDFQGLTWPEPITYSGSINLYGVRSFSEAAEKIQNALNSNLPETPVAVTSGS